MHHLSLHLVCPAHHICHHTMQECLSLVHSLQIVRQYSPLLLYDLSQTALVGVGSDHGLARERQSDLEDGLVGLVTQELSGHIVYLHAI